MNPRSTFRSCWCAGGSIERRSGPLSCRRAIELARFHLSEAEAQWWGGQSASSAYCLMTAVELLAAIDAAFAWRSAADGSCVARKLT